MNGLKLGIYQMTIKSMIGKTFTKVYTGGYNDELTFENDVERYTFFHDQDCCESVSIEDICGDLADLGDSPLTMADESCSGGENSDYESYTWTFYKFATLKGFVDVRWYGSSDGYYSESVHIKYEML